MAERLDVEGGRYGIRPDQATPVPNKTDAAWERLQALRAQARDLGINVDDRWPLATLEAEIARHT